MKVNKLLQLLRDNPAHDEGRQSAIRAEAGDDGVDIYVYDVIDPYWGASAAGLIAALVTAAGQPVCLHINSPGGDVFEARAMAAAIAGYGGKVEAQIDGLCASAATYVALAASSVSMVDGALLMIHNSWTIAYGDKTDLRGTADLLEKIDGTIVADYAKKTKATADQVQTWMDAETWFTAQEALDAGFIDEIEPNTQQGDAEEDATEPADPLMARWDLSAYAKAPKVAPRRAPPAPREDVAARAAAQLLANRNRLRLITQI
jgi:ATP-dependent Clp protease protease subunit